MTTDSKIMVRVQKNGVVVHKHEGANGFHDPSRKHEGAETTAKGHLHLNKAKLAKPEGWDKLTEAEQTQYAEAINGKTFWIYPGKKTSGLTMEEEAALVAEMDAGFPEPVVETPTEEPELVATTE